VWSPASYRLGECLVPTDWTRIGSRVRRSDRCDSVGGGDGWPTTNVRRDRNWRANVNKRRDTDVPLGDRTEQDALVGGRERRTPKEETKAVTNELERAACSSAASFGLQ